MAHRIHRVGAFATIWDDRGYILLSHRRDADYRNQPGGGMEPGETPWEAAVREVREEVGLEVAVERLAGVYSWATTDDLIFSFACRVVGGALTTSRESDQAGTSHCTRFGPTPSPSTPSAFAMPAPSTGMPSCGPRSRRARALSLGGADHERHEVLIR